MKKLKNRGPGRPRKTKRKMPEGGWNFLKRKDKKKYKYTIFIGYDDRDSVRYEVLKHSLLHNVDDDVQILPLKHEDLRKAGVFTFEFNFNKQGRLYSDRDVTPRTISKNEQYYMYTRTRFYLPAYCLKKGIKGQVLYLDPNFLCLPDTDIRHLFSWAERNNDSISVCKSIEKLDKRSGLVLYNMDNPVMLKLNLHQNKTSLASLAKFSWMEPEFRYRDPLLGDIPEPWFIPTKEYDEAKIQRLLWFPKNPLSWKGGINNKLWLDEYYSYLVDRLVPEVENM